MTVKEKSQTLAQQLLAKRYLASLKENPEQNIGVELEFPIVNTLGNKTDVLVAKALFKYLQEVEEFIAIKLDEDGNPVQLQHEINKDQIVFELSYNTIEFALEKAKTIQEVERRFTHYLSIIQPFLREKQHQIEGRGLHPCWRINDNQPVKIDRYKMLIQFLQLAEKNTNRQFHNYPDYGTFICGNQVQLDVSRNNYLKVINSMNKVEPAKAYLFANSIFDGENWDTMISRDIFWEDSMHGYYQENVGVNPKAFINEQDFLDYLAKTAMFYVYREGEILYFEPIRVEDYLAREKIVAYRLNGTKQDIKPQEEDLKNHRSYHFQDLTTRGTIEYRSVCTQPLNKTFVPIAFHVGLHHNIKELEEYLAHNNYFDFSKENPKELRRRYSKKHLTETELEKIKKYSLDLLTISKRGLIDRGKQEEVYLEEIINELGKC